MVKFGLWACDDAALSSNGGQWYMVWSGLLKRKQLQLDLIIPWQMLNERQSTSKLRQLRRRRWIQEKLYTSANYTYRPKQTEIYSLTIARMFCRSCSESRAPSVLSVMSSSHSSTKTERWSLGGCQVWGFMVLGILLAVLAFLLAVIYFSIRTLTTSLEHVETIPTYANAILVSISSIMYIYFILKWHPTFPTSRFSDVSLFRHPVFPIFQIKWPNLKKYT